MQDRERIYIVPDNGIPLSQVLDWFCVESHPVDVEINIGNIVSSKRCVYKSDLLNLANTPHIVKSFSLYNGELSEISFVPLRISEFYKYNKKLLSKSRQEIIDRKIAGMI